MSRWRPQSIGGVGLGLYMLLTSSTCHDFTLSPDKVPFGLGVSTFAAPTYADIDGDGDFDVFVGKADGSISFFLNVGDSTNPIFSQIENSAPFGLSNVGEHAKPTFVDIDNDGDLDAFVGTHFATYFFENTGTSIASFSLNNDSEPFGLSNVGEHTKPTFVDIDGDTDLDAFVGNESGDILFFRNEGTTAAPSFVKETDSQPFGLYSVESNAAPVFVDIDEDGDIDAYIGLGDGTTSFFRNDGTTDSAPFSSYNYCYSFLLGDIGFNSIPAFADIDGDGDLDAIVGAKDGSINFYSNDVGYGNAYFSLEDLDGITYISAYSNAAFADIDNDGDLDVFIGAKNGDITFFENIGSATLAEFSEVSNTAPFGLSSYSSHVAPTFIDIDADGDLDVFVGTSDGYTVFFENTGTPTLASFQPPYGNYSVPFGLSSVGSYSKPSFADIDGDGDYDVFVGNGQGYIRFFKNEGTPTSASFVQDAAIAPFGLSDVGYNAAPTFMDFNGSGLLDAFIGQGDGSIAFFLNAGTSEIPDFVLANAYSPFGDTDVGKFSTPSFADIDNDGDLDAFIGAADGHINFFAGKAGDSSFLDSSAVVSFGLSNTGGDSKPTFIDIDGDGDFDAFVNIEDGIRFFRNEGSSLSANFISSSGLNPFSLGSYPSNLISFADIDGDGDLDGFNGTISGNIVFQENFGNACLYFGTSFDNNQFGFSNVGSRATPTFVDIDGDGDLDAFVGEADGNINFFANNGNSTNPLFEFVSTNSEPFGLTDVGTNSAPAFVDIDGDGDYDAFIGGGNGNINFFENQGTASEPTFVFDSEGPPFGLVDDVGLDSAPTFIDIDADGDLDAFVGESNGYILFFENKPCKSAHGVNHAQLAQDLFMTEDSITSRAVIRKSREVIFSAGAGMTLDTLFEVRDGATFYGLVDGCSLQ